MRILFLSHYFPPEVNAPASRTFEHCRVWAQTGHEAFVVTNVPNHPAGKIYPGYRNALAQSETVADIKVYRLLTFLAANRGIVRRSFSYFFYLVMSVLAAPFLPRVDVVVSTSPQFFCGLAGYFVSRIKRVPWVLEIRDLWPESIMAVGAVSRSLTLRWLVWLANFAYRKADLHPVRHGFLQDGDHGRGHSRREDRGDQERRGPGVLFAGAQPRSGSGTDSGAGEYPGQVRRCPMSARTAWRTDSTRC